MAALFAFLHHLAAFVLVAAIAVEFVLIKSELNVANARKILRADQIYGAAAGALLVVGLLRVFFLREGCSLLLPQRALHSETRALRRRRAAVDLSDQENSFVASCLEGGSGTSSGRADGTFDARGASLGAGRHRSDSAVCGTDGARSRVLRNVSGWRVAFA